MNSGRCILRFLIHLAAHLQALELVLEDARQFLDNYLGVQLAILHT